MRKFAYFFYPDLTNDFPDVPAAGNRTGTNYINKKLTKIKIKTNVSSEEKANEQSYIVPRTTNQKKSGNG